MIIEGRLDKRQLDVLRQVAPGTSLRQGLERVLRGETGAILVLGAPPQVEALFTGGFRIDVPFTAQRITELAKMDGALVLDETASEILWANIHLMPDPAIETVETGTRHRTAERVARQTSIPVITVSESMHIITLYLDGWRHVLDDVGKVLSRANQAVQTLEHYRLRFDEASGLLNLAELEGRATMRDVLSQLGRAEMVDRVAGELERYVAELGVEGRLLQLQLDELSIGVQDDKALAVRDHRELRERGLAEVLPELSRRSPEELLDAEALAGALDLGASAEALDAIVVPRGYRLLSKVPALPAMAVERVVERFGSLKVILAVSLEDLEEVEGVGPARARQLRDGLRRLAEISAHERHH